MTQVEISDLRDSYNYLHESKEINTDQMLVQIRNLYEKAKSFVVKDGFEDLMWRTMQLDNDIGLKAKQVYKNFNFEQKELNGVPVDNKLNVSGNSNVIVKNNGNNRIGRKLSGSNKKRSKDSKTEPSNPVIEEEENEDESIENSNVNTLNNVTINSKQTSLKSSKTQIH